MDQKFEYMVSLRGPKPDVVRVGADHVFRRFDPREPGEWVESKFLDAFAWGGGDYVWYDDVTEEQANEYIKQIRDYWAKNK